MPSTRQRSTRNRLMLVATVAGGGFLALGACGSPSNPDTVGTTTGGDDVTVGGGCEVPAKGCPCAPDGLTQSCEAVVHYGDYTTCSQGKLTCTGGTWSACNVSHAMFKSLGPVGAPMPAQPQVLSDAAVFDAGDAGTCSACDPTCLTFVDTSTGLDGGSGLTPTDGGGWTLPLGMGDGSACIGLQCSVPNCSGGQTTTVTGKVYDPASLNPVFNAVVAIPNGTVVPIPAGVSSDPCGGAPLPAAVSFAYSATDGSFTLTGVPVGASIPLVIQIGRWRRVTTINTSGLTCGHSQNISPAASCQASYATTAACPTRLPRTQGEGNIPHIAIATGGLDAIECMLYRMGVSSSEYTDENGSGRVHIFNDGGSVLGGANANHDLSYLMGFTCPSGCAGSNVSTSSITNPSFETGNFNGWTTSGSYKQISNWWSTAGNDSALLGTGEWQGPCNFSGVNTATQNNLVAPANATSINVDEFELCWANGNYAKVALTDNTSGGTVTCQDCAWDTQETCTLPVTPGHSYTLALTNNDTAASGTCTETFFDNVRWTITTAVPNLLPNYDLVMLPCDGGGEYNSSNWGYSYDDPGRLNLVNYANVGGRVFSSHWGREWIERPFNGQSVGPFQGSTAATQSATWIVDQSGNSTTGVINTVPVYGQNFDAWMKAVGATGGTTFTINPWREDSSAVAAASRLFVTFNGNDGTTNNYPADFTFDTPLGAASPVGRVMYTDMHLANGTPSGTFPGNCPAQGGALSQQEDAAEYLLFDLGSCVNGLPPPVTMQYNPATFTRDYQATCPGVPGPDGSTSGSRPVWHAFQYEDTTPSDSNIMFTAYTADSQAQLGSQYMAAPLNVASGADNCAGSPPAGPSCSTAFVGVDVDTQLQAAGVPKSGQPPYSSHSWLRVTMTLNPSSDKMSAPTLIAWNQAYDCVPSE